MSNLVTTLLMCFLYSQKKFFSSQFFWCLLWCSPVYAYCPVTLWDSLLLHALLSKGPHTLTVSDGWKHLHPFFFCVLGFFLHVIVGSVNIDSWGYATVLVPSVNMHISFSEKQQFLHWLAGFVSWWLYLHVLCLHGTFTVWGTSWQYVSEVSVIYEKTGKPPNRPTLVGFQALSLKFTTHMLKIL